MSSPTFGGTAVMTRAAASSVLGVDLGTGSVRAGLYSQVGSLLMAHEEPITTSHPRPGWAEQSPEEVLAATYRAVAAAAAGHERGLHFSDRGCGWRRQCANRSVAAVDGHSGCQRGDGDHEYAAPVSREHRRPGFARMDAAQGTLAGPT